ncbi:hypothetical protein GYMLUDRAFT_247008 [Collybiopsis luxurians FD-317 M1]|uniref:Uncharacterized protein n=1 Tax=Collybiopsis luxurians FD-317 M1 TaxID=944289 RepID=A0A0D0CPR8_9AGAR|nr:hypothetical protein GYMLUDRAFT_247008 [Collybiopsis luxurians FD-317 M1]
MLKRNTVNRYDKLRADLSMLKLPHPPMANVAEPTDKDIAFYWQTKKHSRLWGTIDNVVRMIENSRESVAALMNAAQIDRVWKEELYGHVNPFTLLPGTRPNQASRRMSSPNPHLRHKPRSPSRTCYRSQSRSPSSRRSPSLSLSRQNSYPEYRSSLARRKSSLEYRRRQRSRSLSPPRRTLSSTKTEDALRSIESVQMALIDIQNGRGKQEGFDDRQGEVWSVGLPPPHPSLPSIPNTSPSPTAPSFAPPPPPYSPPPLPSERSSKMEAFNTPTSLPTPDSQYLPKESSDLEDVSMSFDKNSLPIEDYKSNARRISELTREFWDTRRNISAISQRCLSLEKQIRAELDKANRRKGEDLLAEAERTLQYERKRRKDAEVILEDVLRECKNPTIVPTLLNTLACSEFNSEHVCAGYQSTGQSAIQQTVGR